MNFPGFMIDPTMGSKLTGRMKSFSHKSGYGFIHEVTGVQGDVYVPKDQLPIEWQFSDQRIDGQEVMFDPHHMNDGKVHAKNVVALNVQPGGQAVSGTVKSYNPIKGFGFFSVEGFGEDVFFNKDRIPPELAAYKLDGSTAIFCLQQKKDGKYEAFNVQITELKAVPLAGSVEKRPLNQLTVLDDPFSKRTRFQQTVVPNHNGALQPMMEDVPYHGNIKSFRAGNNYGFIICPHASGDLRFHINDVLNGDKATILPNQDVTFFARTSPDGRLQAYNVALLDTSNGGLPTPGKSDSKGAAQALQEIREMLPSLRAPQLTKLHTLVGQMMLGCN